MFAVAAHKKRRAIGRRLPGEPLGHSPHGRANSTRGMVAPKRGGIEENGRFHPPQATGRWPEEYASRNVAITYEGRERALLPLPGRRSMEA